MSEFELPPGSGRRLAAHEVLEVPDDADEETIGSAARRKSVELHPQNGGSEEALAVVQAAAAHMLARDAEAREAVLGRLHARADDWTESLEDEDGSEPIEDESGSHRTEDEAGPDPFEDDGSDELWDPSHSDESHVSHGGDGGGGDDGTEPPHETPRNSRWNNFKSEFVSAARDGYRFVGGIFNFVGNIFGFLWHYGKEMAKAASKYAGIKSSGGGHSKKEDHGHGGGAAHGH